MSSASSASYAQPGTRADVTSAQMERSRSHGRESDARGMQTPSQWQCRPTIVGNSAQNEVIRPFAQLHVSPARRHWSGGALIAQRTPRWAGGQGWSLDTLHAMLDN